MLNVAVRRRQGTFLLDVAFATTHRRIVLFGPSGAGKTMTLRCLAGLLLPDQGRIEVDGIVLFDRVRRVNIPPWRRQVGMVQQAYTLFPHLTVGDNVAYGLSSARRGEARARVASLLSAVGLAGYETRMPAQLSGGQQQRVALAQALASEPRLLVLDEPFSAVDAAVRERLRRDLLALVEEFRVPLVFVTHDFGEAYLLGETIVMLAAGHVVQTGSPAEVAEFPRTAVAARLVGATNILRGRAVDADGGGLVIRVGSLSVRTPGAGPRAGGRAGRETIPFCIRPEHIRLVPPREGGLSATITRVLSRYDLATVLLAGDGLTLEATVRGVPPSVGSRVGVEIPEGTAHVLDEEPEEVMDECS